jgi:hypothetical protein
MVKWTTTPEEYEHARKVILEMPYGQQVSITMKNGAILEGWIVGSSSGNDVGDNLTRGRGPIITSMYGENRDSAPKRTRLSTSCFRHSELHAVQLTAIDVKAGRLKFKLRH